MDYLKYIGAAIIVLFNLGLFYRQKRIESNLKKNEFIHRMQFEKEFQLYMQIWDIIVEVKRIVFRLNTDGDFVEKGKTLEETKQEVIALAAEKGQVLMDLAYKNEPFFYPNVFESIHKLCNIMLLSKIRSKNFHEHRRHSSNIPFEYERRFWEDSEKAIETYNNLTDDVCLKIRERIGIISGSGGFFSFF